MIICIEYSPITVMQKGLWNIKVARNMQLLCSTKASGIIEVCVHSVLVGWAQTEGNGYSSHFEFKILY
jgi:hypothetical protein